MPLKILPLTLLALGLLFILNQKLSAQPPVSLTLGVYQGFTETYPNLLPQLKKAAASQGINLNYKHNLPANRSLMSAANGNLDGDILRQPFAVEGLPSLVQVNVPLARFEFWVWVLANSHCPPSEAELVNFKPVGLLGIKYFDLVYRHSKVGFEQVTGIPAMAKMLKLGRADYSLAGLRTIELISKSSGVKLKPCFQRPYISLDGFMYLHRKHQALVPLLEAAFKPLARHQ